MRGRRLATYCQYCQKPSSPEERAAFVRWRKWEALNDPTAPQPAPTRKRGRPKKAKPEEDAMTAEVEQEETTEEVVTPPPVTELEEPEGDDDDEEEDDEE
jgi:hypothetical protein